jgi:hypothetical protein
MITTILKTDIIKVLALAVIWFSASVVSAEQCLVYFYPDHIVIDKDAGIFTKLSVKVDVKNNCDRDIQGLARFNAASRGFKITEKPLIINMKQRLFLNSRISKKEDYDRIDSIDFEVAGER